MIADTTNLDKNCNVCLAYKSSQCNSPKLLPVKGKRGKYIIIESGVSAAEDEKGELFSGSMGRRVRQIIKQSDIDIEDVIFTSAVRCRGNNTQQEIQLCGETVRDLIETHQPDSVVCLGENALRAVFPNATKGAFTTQRVRGSRIPYNTKAGKTVTCIATYSQICVNSLDEDNQRMWEEDIGSMVYRLAQRTYEEPTIIVCKDVTQLRVFSKKLKEADTVAWDFETTSLKPYRKDGKTSELFSAAFAFTDNTVYVLPLLNYYPTNIQKAVMEVLHEWFYNWDTAQKRIAHNTKFDLLWGLYKTAKQEVTADKITNLFTGQRLVSYEDTSLLCWMNDERPGMSGLKVSAWRYLGVDDWSVDVKDVRKLPLQDVLNYNAKDAVYTLRLYQCLEPQVCRSKESNKLYRGLLLPAMVQFMKIEMRGITIDVATRERLYNKYKGDIDTILRDVREITGKPSINPNSSKQLQDYFIGECGYTLTKKTKTGFSTDIESMESVVDTYNDGVAKRVLEFRGVSKLQSTYIEGLGKHIYGDGRIHGGYNLTATVTGRTSSSEPNMQNFPKHKAKEVRGIVVAPKGYKLCSFDYGQIEARLFAVMTGDERYCKDLEQGYDIHTETALKIYRDGLGMTEKEAKAKRNATKSAVFAIFYGAGAYTIAEALGIDQSRAEQVKRDILSRYRRIGKWQSEIADRVAVEGCVKSLYGRVRRAPIRYTELLNFTTQSTASDMTLTAMTYLGRRYNIAFMIHDDLSIFLKDDDELESHITYIIEAMLVLPWLELSKSPLMKAFAPLQVECEVGANWAEQESAGSADSIQMGYSTVEANIQRATEIRDELLGEGW